LRISADPGPRDKRKVFVVGECVIVIPIVFEAGNGVNNIALKEARQGRDGISRFRFMKSGCFKSYGNAQPVLV